MPNRREEVDMERSNQLNGASPARTVRRARWSRSRRVAALGSVLAATLAIGTMGVAVSAATIGNPQPELAQFSVGTPGNDGAGVVLPDGNTVYSWSSGDSTLKVCTLHPGSRACVSTATLTADSRSGTADNLYGPPVILSTGGKDVSVIADDLGGNSGIDGEVLSYNSTNDGVTFGPATIVSTSIYSVNAGTVAGGQVVIADINPHQGVEVQAVEPQGGSPTEYALLTPSSSGYEDLFVSAYDGGVLVGFDDLTNAYVYYAPAGSDFSSTSSYSLVGTFDNELVAGLSGNAILTTPGGVNSSLTSAGIISFFDGSGFGLTYKVPDSKAGDDGYFILQETGPAALPGSTNATGDYHVFFEGRRDSYDLIEESTTNGQTWTPQTFYGTAVSSNDPVPVLGATGAGQVLESASPMLSQPVLNTQGVTISLEHPTVLIGKPDVLRGQASWHIAGLGVVLQEEIKHDEWQSVTSTHESATGGFTFTVPGRTVTYRAVVSDDPGYFQYGYSNAATQVAVPPKKK
jgi:hypothetical protein